MKNALPARQTAQAWVIPLILAAATLLAYGGIVNHEFILLDDPDNLWRNPNFNPPTLAGVMHYWTHAEFGLYIPATYIVWGILAAMARVSPDPMGVALNPAVFHAVSLAAHLLSALAAFAILERLLHDRRAACIGALFFALHPVQVESVAWAAGLKDVLAGMFGLLAIWQYVESLETPQKKGHYAVAAASFLLALLAKPSAVVVPVIAMAIDVWLLRRPLKSILLSLLPWFVLSVVFAVIAKAVQPGTGIPAAPLWARPLVALDSIAFYLWKMIWPFNLAIDYGHRPLVVMQRWWFYCTWIVPIGLAAVAWRNRKRNPEFLVGAIILVAALLPVLGLITFLFQFYSTTADHYLYLAMLGPALIAGWTSRQRRGAIIVGFVVALLGIRTMFQAALWRDDLSLFAHATEVNPRSIIGWNNLGMAYNLRGMPDRAKPAFERAIEVDPDYPESHNNLANVFEQQGRWKEAVVHRRRALEIYHGRPREIQADYSMFETILAEDLRHAGETSAPATTQSSTR